MEKNSEDSWKVYIVRCSDDTLYTGVTKDLDRRIEEHNSGSGAKYTRSRTPVELVWSETKPSRSEAQKREHEIKSFSREKKLELINVRS